MSVQCSLANMAACVRSLRPTQLLHLGSLRVTVFLGSPDLLVKRTLMNALVLHVPMAVHVLRP